MTENMTLTNNEPVERKTYTAPAIVHELKLETRAGTPLRPGLVDPLGLDPNHLPMDPME
jgi:hypothetical protein